LDPIISFNLKMYIYIPDSISWEILQQAKSVLSHLAQSGCHLSYMLGSCSINCIKPKLAVSSIFHAI
jgi:hypothetical protein